MPFTFPVPLRPTIVPAKDRGTEHVSGTELKVPLWVFSVWRQLVAIVPWIQVAFVLLLRCTFHTRPLGLSYFKPFNSACFCCLLPLLSEAEMLFWLHSSFTLEGRHRRVVWPVGEIMASFDSSLGRKQPFQNRCWNFHHTAHRSFSQIRFVLSPRDSLVNRVDVPCL